MLGFSSISESPISSLASYVFFIRGNGQIEVEISSAAFSGRLDIFGNQSNILSVGVSSVGIIKIAKRRKIIIARAVKKSLYQKSPSKKITAH